MKFSKLLFILLTVSVMMPTFAGSKATRHRSGHYRRVVAIVRCKGGSCRRGTPRRAAPKMGMKKVFATCKTCSACQGGVCTLRR